MKNTLFVSLLVNMTFFVGHAHAQPEGGSVVFGDGAIVQSPGNTLVNQNSDRLAIDWGSFNLGAGQVLQFSQPSAAAIALNRDFSGQRSEIYGDILANGNVFIINQNGVLFGGTATVNTAGLLVSDLDLDMETFSSNQFKFADASKSVGGITNNGNLYANSPIGIHLLGQQIVNNGSIRTDNADIQLTTADSVVVLVNPQTGLGIEMQTPIDVVLDANGALVTNTDSIVANGGNIYFNSLRSESLNTLAVRNTGLVSAVAINEENGQIFLVEETQDTTDSDQLEKIIEESQASQEVGASEQGSSGSQVASFEGNNASLNQVMPDCDPEKGDRDCKTQNALKSFLGRMLIGGGLP